MEHHSLSELNKYIRQVIALNFSDHIWIHAEISQIKDSKGNIYIDLIEQDKSTEKILAKMHAMMLYRNVIFIKKKLGAIMHEVLQAGNEILIRIKVDYSEVYGLKLIIEDLDAGYTYGQVELKRKEILQRIEKEGFKHLNRRVTLPSVLQNIAIISSQNAAGYQDFIKQLTNNNNDYQFNATLFSSSVQGEKAVNEIIDQLRNIHQQTSNFDVIVIVRGGGSKFDLSAFDNYEIAKEVSNAKLPVLSGIGHDVDVSVLDIVSHTALKTPTAVADFIIEHNAVFESKLINLGERIRTSFIKFSHSQALNLSNLEQKLESHCRSNIRTEEIKITQMYKQIKSVINALIDKRHQHLDMAERIIESSNPDLILKKGFAIVSRNKELISDARELKKGDIIDTQLMRGHLKSEVITKR